MSRDDRRHGTGYIVQRYNLKREILESSLDAYPSDAFITWEAHGVRLPDGRRTAPCYALWAPSSAIQTDNTPIRKRKPKLTTNPASVRQAGATKRVPKHKNILRIDDPERGLYGYRVRVQWRGEIRQAWFADTTHGDRLGALHAAIDFKRRAYQELGKPLTDQQVIGKARSNTGHVGITRRIKAGKAVIEAFWIEEGKRRSASFGILEHGERTALRLAIAARQQGEKRRLTGEIHDNQRDSQPRSPKLASDPRS